MAKGAAVAEELKVERAEHSRRFVVRHEGGHVGFRIDDLIDSLIDGGDGTPVVDIHTGEVVAIAHPDDDGVLTYVDPTPTIVQESSGSRSRPIVGRSVAVRVLPLGSVDPRATGAPDIGLGLPDAEPLDFLPFTSPTCNGARCQVNVPCRGFATRIPLPPRMFDLKNLGSSPVEIVFIGRAVDGQAEAISMVTVAGGGNGPNLTPPARADSVLLGCTGGGSTTVQWTEGIS